MREKASSFFHKEYLAFGTRRVSYAISWLALGLMVGTAMGVVFVANRSGEFESLNAASTQSFVNTTSALPSQTKIPVLFAYHISDKLDKAGKNQLLVGAREKIDDEISAIGTAFAGQAIVNSFGTNQL